MDIKKEEGFVHIQLRVVLDEMKLPYTKSVDDYVAQNFARARRMDADAELKVIVTNLVNEFYRPLMDARETFLGRTITDVKYLGSDTLDMFQWNKSPILFTLDDGTRFMSIMDDELNGPGKLYILTKEQDAKTI